MRTVLLSAVLLASSAPLFAQETPQQPRQLNQDDMAGIRQSVEKSKARNAQAIAEQRAQQQERARQKERDQALEAERLAQEAQADAEAEAERRQKAARWERQKQASEQALAQSLDRLNDTTTRVQARQRQAAEVSRRQSDAGALEVRRDTAAVSTPSRPAAGPAGPVPSSPSEPLMGFPGRTCAEARKVAQNWVGADGSFDVAHEIPQAGGCLVQIRLDTVRHGSGTASRQ